MKIFEDKDIDLMLVDDHEDILNLSETVLDRENSRFDIQTTTDPFEVLETLENEGLDAIISDYDMPQMTGVDLLDEVRAQDRELPFILYTGKGTEDIAEEAIHAGVTNYFQKEAGTDHYRFLANSVLNSVERYRDRERADIMSSLVDMSSQPVVVTDDESMILYVNEALEQVSGYSAEELIGENPRILSSGEHSESLFEEMYETLRNGDTFKIEDMTNVTKEGDFYLHDQTLTPISPQDGDPKYFVAISDLKI